MGRSRGGYGTKVHLRSDANGLPLGFVLTPGEDHETTVFSDLDALVDARPRCWLGDRAYDSDALRADLQPGSGSGSSTKPTVNPGNVTTAGVQILSEVFAS